MDLSLECLLAKMVNYFWSLTMCSEKSSKFPFLRKLKTIEDRLPVICLRPSIIDGGADCRDMGGDNACRDSSHRPLPLCNDYPPATDLR